MTGTQIYLTSEERQAVIETCREWCEIMSSGDETFELVDERLENGLGSAFQELITLKVKLNNYIKKMTLHPLNCMVITK